ERTTCGATEGSVLDRGMPRARWPPQGRPAGPTHDIMASIRHRGAARGHAQGDRRRRAGRAALPKVRRPVVVLIGYPAVKRLFVLAPLLGVLACSGEDGGSGGAGGMSAATSFTASLSSRTFLC